MFLDRIVAAFVHREAFTAPVAADAHPPLLVDDSPAIFPFPLPGPLQKGFPADHLLGQAFLAHGLHDLDLRGDRRVVGSRQPEGRIPLHAVIADRRILQDAVHGVTHMQLPGDVGRRHDDGKGLLSLLPMRDKGTCLLPGLIDLSLDFLRIEAGCHIRASHPLFHGTILHPS